MLPTKQVTLALLGLVLAASVCCSATSGTGDQTTNSIATFKELTADEQAEQSAVGRAQTLANIRANSRLLAVPHSLARFLFYNSRGPSERQVFAPAEQQSAASPNGYKRSSSQLDALNGVTLGKRSASAAEFVNYEPVFGRQSLTRTPARVYDMRWAPFDSIVETGPNNVQGRDSDY